MLLRKHRTPDGARWSIDNRFLPESWTIGQLLRLPRVGVEEHLAAAVTDTNAAGELLAPMDDAQELWASGVTYIRSREARKAESDGSRYYDDVYDAERPELFLKSVGWRVVGAKSKIGIRRDSTWNVAEPELALVVNRHLETVGFTIGNDVSSRSIEGENPLYLPQAKVFDGGAALGPAILLSVADEDPSFDVGMVIQRDGAEIFRGNTSTREMKRSFDELVRWLGSHLGFPNGVVLMTGTGIVPDDGFTLMAGDRVCIHVPEIGTLENDVSLCGQAERTSDRVESPP